ncbi:MAG TPA: hypothetical protein VH572_10695 [Gaiella sp.]|jgi:hypothetical protein
MSSASPPVSVVRLRFPDGRLMWTTNIPEDVEAGDLLHIRGSFWQVTEIDGDGIHVEAPRRPASPRSFLWLARRARGGAAIRNEPPRGVGGSSTIA